MSMKVRSALLCLALLARTQLSSAQQTVITALDSGVLTWTGDVANARYRIEWTPDPAMPWRSDSPFTSVIVTGNTGTATVPMFYRLVRYGAGYAITGTVFYSSNALPDQAVHLTTRNFAPLGVTTSSPAGSYAFTGLTNGEYLVGCDTEAGYQGTYYSVTLSGNSRTMDVYRPKLLSMLDPPADAIVTNASPAFSWSTLPEARTYSFGLYTSTPWSQVESSGNLFTNTYQIAAALSNAVHYTWLVWASDAQGHTVGGSQGSQFTTQLP
jgi:hypothetical protein